MSRISGIRNIREIERSTYEMIRDENGYEFLTIHTLKLEICLDGVWYYTMVRRFSDDDWFVFDVVSPVFEGEIHYDKAGKLSVEDQLYVIDVLMNHPMTRLILLLN
jgi:hypothetical protein